MQNTSERLLEKVKELNISNSNLEEKVNEISEELIELRNENENFLQVIERNKKMENFLKKELQEKEQEISKRTELLKDLQFELTNLNDELLCYKKENLTLKSKIDLMENDIGGKYDKYDNELNGKNHEIFLLKEKISDFQKNVETLKECLERKNRCIQLKKNANYTLLEIIKSKRNEVKCVEAMQVMESEKMQENLKMIRHKENSLLKEYFI